MNLEELYRKLSSKIDESNTDLRVALTSKIDAVSSQVSLLGATVKTLQTKTESQDMELMIMRREINARNVVIHNLPYDPNSHEDIKGFVINELNDRLEINLTDYDVDEVFQMGKTPKAPIKVKFVNLKTKNLIFKRKKDHLRGSNVSIIEDMPKELRKHLSEQRKAKDANKRTSDELTSPNGFSQQPPKKPDNDMSKN